MFRILLSLGVSLVLLDAGMSTAADGSGRPDGRLLPDGADIRPATRATRPDDRISPGSLSELAIVTGRSDGRLVPDSVDARNVTPVVVSVDDGVTASFDWFAALIGGLVVAGVALAMAGRSFSAAMGLSPLADLSFASDPIRAAPLDSPLPRSRRMTTMASPSRLVAERHG